MTPRTLANTSILLKLKFGEGVANPNPTRHDRAMPKKPFPSDNRDAEIRALKASLYASRSAIIDLVPEALRTILEASYFCASRNDVYEWESWAVEQLLSAAQIRENSEMGVPEGSSFRAYCPLCNGSSQGSYSLGYAMPTGMKRHLEGSSGSRRCSIFAAAMDMRLDAIKEQTMPGHWEPNCVGMVPSKAPWKMLPNQSSEQRPSAVVLKFPLM